MTEFTYSPPESTVFLHTLRSYLQATGKDDIANLLANSSYEVSSCGSFSHVRWNSYDATVRFFVPVVRIPKFTEEVRKDLLCAVDAVFPREVGFEITDVEISPILEAPPDDESSLSNSALLGSKGTIEHDGLRFRSRSEIKLYEALKKRHVLFFANATAVLGSKDVKREPDFLVCQNGKWGILEVMGEQYHPSTTAMRDHDRARLFKDYGLFYIEFYDAARCYNKPDEVVDDFLQRLSKV